MDNQDYFLYKDFMGVPESLVVIPFKELMQKYNIKFESFEVADKPQVISNPLIADIRAKFRF